MSTTLDAQTIAALARQLYDARKQRVQLRHFSQQHPGMTIADGYAIQRAWVALEVADGRTIKGRKIGLTSRAMQQASQITEPDFAPLMDDMFFASGGDIPIEPLHRAAHRGRAGLHPGQALEGPGRDAVSTCSPPPSG
jgi:2-oxo-hept-3-ene-1,7-dioate hydratase